MEIREHTIQRAWPKVLSKVLHMGQPVYIENYGWTIEIDEPLMVRIGSPILDRICPESGWDERKLEVYYQQCVTPSNEFGFDYTYSMRFRDNDGVDQLEKCMDILDKDSNSRRAVACTWIPKEDYGDKSHPCQILQDRKIRDGKLNLTSYFRSHDMFSAWTQNLYMLSRFIEDDAEHLGCKAGTLTCISNAAHIYERDIKDAAIVIDDIELGKKVLAMLGEIDENIAIATRKNFHRG